MTALFRVLLAALALATLIDAAEAQGYGANLIVNPGAEAGPSPYTGDNFSRQLDNWVVITGPTTSLGFSGYQWGAPGGFPAYTDQGPEPPATRGVSFFYGGNNSSIAEGRQVLAIISSGVQADIDALLVAYDLSGWFGGFAGQRDNARLTLRFLDAGDVSLGSTVIGAVTPGERNNLTGLLFREGQGTVPAGTRALEFTLTMTRLDGTANDGYADNLSLVLSAAVPEPSVIALGSLAAMGSGLVVRRFWGKRRVVKIRPSR